MQRLLSYRHVRFPVAAILIFAALAKIHETATTPSDRLEWFAVGVVLFESTLALLLVSGVWPRIIKYLAATVFLCFFSVSLSLAWQAAASCGCFGRVHVDPRITATLDAVVVLLLVFATTKKPSPNPSRKQIGFLVAGLLVSMILVVPMLFHPPVARVVHPAEVREKTSPSASIESPAGLVPSTIHLGYVEPKSVHRFALELVNDSDHDWTIDNLKTECTCLVAVDKVTDIVPAGKQISIPFEFTAPDIVGHYSKTISLTAGEKTWETQMTARIALPLDVKPESLTFSTREGINEQTITVHNEGSTPVRLLYATVSPPGCQVKIGNAPIPPGGGLSLPVVRLDSRTDRTIMITISTNHRQQKTLRIPINIAE